MYTNRTAIALALCLVGASAAPHYDAETKVRSIVRDSSSASDRAPSSTIQSSSSSSSSIEPYVATTSSMSYAAHTASEEVSSMAIPSYYTSSEYGSDPDLSSTVTTMQYSFSPAASSLESLPMGPQSYFSSNSMSSGVPYATGATPIPYYPERMSSSVPYATDATSIPYYPERMSSSDAFSMGSDSYSTSTADAASTTTVYVAATESSSYLYAPSSANVDSMAIQSSSMQQEGSYSSTTLLSMVTSATSPSAAATTSPLEQSTATGPTQSTGMSKPKLTGVTTYWGQTMGSLDTACDTDSGFSNIALAFVTDYFGPGNMPTMNMQGLWQVSAEQEKANATGLLDGTALVPAIKKCQANGKKVLISMGGAAPAANATLANDACGAQLADSMWDLFLGGRNASTYGLRPFGDVKLDGVDLDIENNNPSGYMGFVDQMQQHYTSDRTQDYYLTAAPQCSRNGGAGDASLTDNLLRKMDAAWVQFYNNGDCDLTTAHGFAQSVREWASAIAPAQLWIGAPGSNASAANGYLAPSAIARKVSEVYRMGNLTNLGGWMLWDANTARNNSNYQTIVADAIHAYNGTNYLPVPGLLLPRRHF